MASIPFELKGKTVYVAGHRGMVGSALARRLAQEDVELLTTARSEVDLRDQAGVNQWFAARRPQVVFLAAAKVGAQYASRQMSRLEKRLGGTGVSSAVAIDRFGVKAAISSQRENLQST
jgi:NAD(P)-dependent dehydrogenase (short-subunit alcohol dehydrogenase family)